MLLEFYGTECPHCVKMAQLIERLEKETGLKVIVSHYPPYCSKWNPIEHRLFCHVHRAMSGVVFSNYETVKQLIEQTSTETGLSVIVRLNTKEYKTGIKIDKAELDPNRISHHCKISELNYRIYP